MSGYRNTRRGSRGQTASEIRSQERLDSRLHTVEVCTVCGLPEKDSQTVNECSNCGSQSWSSLAEL